MTDANAQGLSSESDKCILNFFFLKSFFIFFKEFPLILKLGAPAKLFLISTSLNFNLFFDLMALKSASFAANLLAKHSVEFFLFSQVLISKSV